MKLILRAFKLCRFNSPSLGQLSQLLQPIAHGSVVSLVVQAISHPAIWVPGRAAISGAATTPFNSTLAMSGDFGRTRSDGRTVTGVDVSVLIHHGSGREAISRPISLHSGFLCYKGKEGDKSIIWIWVYLMH